MDASKNRLAEFRRGKRWSQERLAFEAGVAARTISRIELGEHVPFRATKRVISLALGVPENVVFPEEELEEAAI
jgi:transcriptional regulator with XRE-family HTH domain